MAAQVNHHSIRFIGLGITTHCHRHIVCNFIRNHQCGHNPHQVVGNTTGGVESVGGQLQTISGKMLRMCGFVIYDLSHPFSIGSAAHGHTQSEVTNTGSKSFGRTGRVAVYQYHR